jgi:hypothetical protein
MIPDACGFVAPTMSVNRTVARCGRVLVCGERPWNSSISSATVSSLSHSMIWTGQLDQFCLRYPFGQVPTAAYIMA